MIPLMATKPQAIARKPRASGDDPPAPYGAYGWGE